MTTYYKSEALAQAEAQRILEADDRLLWAKAELEPYNGWVVVVAAKPRPLDDLADLGYEVDVNGRRTRDPNKKRPTPIAAARPVGTDGAPVRSEPKVGGVSQRVWQLCRDLGGDRKQVIAAAVAEGINDKTAATQYSRWKRAEGAK